MATLVVVTHEYDSFLIRRAHSRGVTSAYLFFDVAKYLYEMGHRTLLARGPEAIEGDAALLHVDAMIVPGSGLVKEQAEAEGLDKIFRAAGFDWREPGCSMCLAMNADRLEPGERCASTSNRNFEGRQGFKGRTHLVSPAMAAAAAVAGHFVDIREWPRH